MVYAQQQRHVIESDGLAEQLKFPPNSMQNQSKYDHEKQQNNDEKLKRLLKLKVKFQRYSNSIGGFPIEVESK